MPIVPDEPILFSLSDRISAAAAVYSPWPRVPVALVGLLAAGMTMAPEPFAAAGAFLAVALAAVIARRKLNR